MEHQRLNNLIYVRYNLRLHQRISRGRNYDPISFEEFVDNGKWVLKDDPSFLTVDEIEEFHKQMAGLTIQTDEGNDENLNLDGPDSGDEVEHSCTNNSERCEDQENQGSETRKDTEEKSEHTNANDDMHQNILITEWNFAGI